MEYFYEKLIYVQEITRNFCVLNKLTKSVYNYMLKTELELFQGSISWKSKFTAVEKELTEQLEAFNWDLAHVFMTHWIRRCMTIYMESILKWRAINCR